MRAEVEKQLNLIAQGMADYHAVRDHALEMFRMKFVYYVKNIAQVDTLFEGYLLDFHSALFLVSSTKVRIGSAASFTSLSDSGKPFSRCGKCRRYMKLVQTKPQRLFCSTCQETYSVPNFKDGVLRPYGEKKCPLDEFELVYWNGSGGKLARSFALCPFCYNNPPFESMKEGDGCSNCPHPACPHSYMANGVCGCLQECGGLSVILRFSLVT
ncbi:hypothetical protein ANCCEY_06964 [Ancylostoma ceylanicum]|uniref:DNA topoisomerase n=1 Tax=Ancylostoma ceylanicum TaxID=53326 RepID=A0A0D6LPG9_9BILA|nr:hypothetical protein ANCCEY_06964 [Ancylostoma ceylanicum]